jgi:putative SOS response-associated peptidase YedK
MCNDYEQHVAWAEYCKLMQALEFGIPTQQSELDLPQADDIKINDLAPVMRASGNGIELAQMRFGFPSSNPRGGPIFNFRSEGRRFDKSNRCLVPASAFFEFTGKKYPKAKHRFALAEAPLMAAKRADAMIELGDVDGQRTWKAVLRAVEELIRTERRSGERLN